MIMMKKTMKMTRRITLEINKMSHPRKGQIVVDNLSFFGTQWSTRDKGHIVVDAWEKNEPHVRSDLFWLSIYPSLELNHFNRKRHSWSLSNVQFSPTCSYTNKLLVYIYNVFLFIFLFFLCWMKIFFSSYYTPSRWWCVEKKKKIERRKEGHCPYK